MDLNDDDQRKARVTETVRESPGKSNEPLVNFFFSFSLCLNQVFSLSAFTGSPHYSEDFEDEENAKEPLEKVCSWDIIKLKLRTLVM